MHTGTSIGISSYMSETAGPDEMLTQADLALYRAKDERRDQYYFRTADLDHEVRDRVALANDLEAGPRTRRAGTLLSAASRAGHRPDSSSSFFDRFTRSMRCGGARNGDGVAPSTPMVQRTSAALI
jgi:hypothetical protein